MIKLSDLDDKTNVVGEYEQGIHTVWDIRNSLKDFQNEKIKYYTTKEYKATINAREMIESAIENEYDNMYEDWEERILGDITEEDIKKIQDILDDILSRDKVGNTSYYQDKEIDLYN